MMMLYEATQSVNRVAHSKYDLHGRHKHNGNTGRGKRERGICGCLEGDKSGNAQRGDLRDIVRTQTERSDCDDDAQSCR